MSWACHVLNHPVTTAKSGDKSRYEMRCGSPPPPGEVWLFLKPATYRENRDNTSQPKAQDCYYVRPSVDHPRDCMRVITAHRPILATQNVTCQHVPFAPPAPAQQLPPIAGEGESTVGEGVSGEGASRQGGGRVEDLYSESDLDMMEVWFPLPPAMREAPAEERGVWVEGRSGRQPPYMIGLPREGQFR